MLKIVKKYEIKEIIKEKNFNKIILFQISFFNRQFSHNI